MDGDPLQLPPEAEVLDYLQSFDYFEQNGRSAEGRAYCTTHLFRFLETLRVGIPRLAPQASVLELGASPYFMTFLIKKYLGHEVTVANFFQDYGERALRPRATTTVRSQKHGEEHRFDYRMFNLEHESYPYPDGAFDLVLCCEILEHLALDPVHMIREAHRVLKPGGYLVLTTPNAKRLQKLWLMLRGWNVYDAYSGDGVYGRHNREYTRWEVDDLLRRNNFEPRVLVHDAYHHGRVHGLMAKLLPSRRDNLFAAARKHGPTVEVHPPWLYVDPEVRVLVREDRIVMGERDSLQLGAGWHGFEHWPPGIRWTRAEASAFLAPKEKLAALRLKLHGGPRGSHVRLLLNGREVERAAIPAAQGRELALPIPEDVARELREGRADVLEVRFLVDDPVVPARVLIGSRDTREIGVAVERIELV